MKMWDMEGKYRPQLKYYNITNIGFLFENKTKEVTLSIMLILPNCDNCLKLTNITSDLSSIHSPRHMN